MSEAVNERVQFRVFVMPCCAHMLCWVNPRYPSWCPECGANVQRRIKESVTVSDPNAHLRYTPDA